jgi:hypothetical protein
MENHRGPTPLQIPIELKDNSFRMQIKGYREGGEEHYQHVQPHPPPSRNHCRRRMTSGAVCLTTTHISA